MISRKMKKMPKICVNWVSLSGISNNPPNLHFLAVQDSSWGDPDIVTQWVSQWLSQDKD